MSTTKLICTLIATVGMYRSCTPPNTATTGEQLSRTNKYDRWVYLTLHTNKPFNLVLWSVGLAEVAVIVASRFSSWPISGRIISLLGMRGNTHDLQLTPFSVTGVLLIAFGTLLREYCYRSLRRFFTFEVSIRKGHKLITTGPYGFVRHPSYTGIVSVFLGSLLWYGTPKSWAWESGILKTAAGKGVFGFLGAFFTLGVMGLLGRMSFEDEALRKTFGQEWDEWAKKVPYMLVPGVY